MSESTGYTFGSSVAGSLQVSHCLGEGGNGRVYQCSLNQRQLAAKFVRYYDSYSIFFIKGGGGGGGGVRDFKSIAPTYKD